MCRIGALKSHHYMHPSKALLLMQSQQKGHDNSGFAMVMQDLGGIFKITNIFRPSPWPVPTMA